MTKRIVDTQVTNLIERLIGLVVCWSECGGETILCAQDLKEVIDNYLNQPGPKVEPAKIIGEELQEIEDD